MSYWIRYKIKKFKIKLYSAIKSVIDSNIDLSKMSRNNRLKYYLKKLLLNPKRIILNLIGKELNVSYVEVVLTTFCTLNCKGCSALMPFYKKRNHLDLDIIIKSLDTLTDSVDSIQKLRLLGGEPLLYPNIIELIKYTLKNDKIKNVIIVTNGTLILSNELIELLKNNKCGVYISDYGIISIKKDELINQLNKNNIKYELKNENSKWRDYGNLECRNRTKKELKKQFSKCGINCSSLFDGKLFYCPRNSHGTNLKKIPLKNEDYIELYNNTLDKKQLNKKLYKFFYKYTPYIEACNYCNEGTNELKKINAGEQEKKNN